MRKALKTQALKTLRYQVELFGPIYKKRQVGKFLASSRTLQHDLGYLNDVVLARRLANLAVAHHADNSALHQVVGFVIGWHTARAEQRMTSLEADWNALRKVPGFWQPHRTSRRQPRQSLPLVSCSDTAPQVVVIHVSYDSGLMRFRDGGECVLRQAGTEPHTGIRP